MHGNHSTRVALVPGAAGSAAFWTPITERLPDDWIVTAIDLPGLGSVPARDDIRSYDDLAEYVAGILAAPSAIVAQSMGAYVALRVALRYPHLVTHLVLVAAREEDNRVLPRHERLPPVGRHWLPVDNARLEET